jgi:ribonuclease-3
MIAYVRGEGERDYKTILQELASAEVRSVPEYRIRERGPDHQKEFTATVFLAGKEWGTGIGRSKKEAEQQAAHQAYVRLSERAEPAEPTEPAEQWGAGGAQGASADARAVAPRKKGA